MQPSNATNMFFTPPQALAEQSAGKPQLTEREMQCLFFISRGCSTKEMARHMDDISPRTVETYLKNLKVKLKMQLRSQLVEFYFTKVECIHGAEG